MAMDITFSRLNHLGIVMLQRPQALNALTLPMILALQKQLQTWQKDNTIHAVIIQAAKGKAFCAGGDIRSLYDGRITRAQQMQFFWHEYRLNHFIHHFDKPYIALLDGITMGGGVGISLHGSHPVASENFTFAMPETGIGFFPDIGASYLLSRCPGQFGVYLGLTGNRIGAADAKALQLVKYLISADQFQSVIASLIEADLSKDAHAKVDECLQRFSMATQPAPIMAFQNDINDSFHFNNVELILAALTGSENAWHRETRQILEMKSPLSLKITLMQILKAKSMRFDECLKMDYCLVGHFMDNHDFYEGVRALLVDKDKSPRWQPTMLSLVTPEQVEAYFACGQRGLPLEFDE